MVVAVVLFVINCAASLYVGWFLVRQHRALVELMNCLRNADADNDELRKQRNAERAEAARLQGIIQRDKF